MTSYDTDCVLKLTILLKYALLKLTTLLNFVKTKLTILLLNNKMKLTILLMEETVMFKRKIYDRMKEWKNEADG